MIGIVLFFKIISFHLPLSLDILLNPVIASIAVLPINIKIFGSTNNTKNVFIKKNYNNIHIPNIKIFSKSKFYINKLIDFCKIENPAIIEIHNRPSYLLKIAEKIA